MKILVLNGPTINMLGVREPEIYGKETYDDLCLLIRRYCATRNIECEIKQSNNEGYLIDAIQQAYYNDIDGIVINPGAYTHTSIAILDALKAVGIPTVEVHISDINKREEFRKNSYVALYAEKRVIGEGLQGYITAIKYLEEKLA